jgi:GTP diphosphokinase / guanosine-3',5'-bis(diphosphate) 3'-diphosphatase
VTKTDLQLFAAAASFAAQQHRRQRRSDKAKTPYINHPLTVANILANEAGVEDVHVLCAALLHDTIEDTDATFEQLVALFGPEIAGIVQEVTDDTSLPTAERKQKQIDSAAKKSGSAKFVKIADKTANLRDLVAIPPHNWGAERLIGYANWSKQVIAPMRGINPKLEAIFDQAFADIENAYIKS